MVTGEGNLTTNFDVSAGTFRSRFMGQQLSNGPRDLATLTLEVTALVIDTGLVFPFGRYETLCIISALTGLMTLT